jgi:hypothetical protein
MSMLASRRRAPRSGSLLTATRRRGLRLVASGLCVIVLASRILVIPLSVRHVRTAWSWTAPNLACPDPPRSRQPGRAGFTRSSMTGSASSRSATARELANKILEDYMKIRLILLCTLSAPLWSFAARAQETVDAAKIPCNQFMLGRIANSGTISIWLIS